MSIADVKKTADQKMQKSIEALGTSLARIRTGRAHAGILDHVQVDYYGSSVPISQVANITLIDARTVGVAPWEKKMANPIEKAIRDCGLGLNPVSMGETIRIPMPPLSEERRKELIKVVKSEGEHARVSVRNLRREALLQELQDGRNCATLGYVVARRVDLRHQGQPTLQVVPECGET